MTTTMNSRLSWAGDILLLNTFRPLLTEEGAAKFRRSLWLAGLQGTLEGVGLFAVIPTITAFVEGGSSMGLTWQGWVWVLAACPAFSFRDSCTWARGWHISPPHSCAVPRPPSS